MQDKQHKKDNKKPDKDPFILYYILWPIKDVIESIIDFFRWVWRTISGAWWCDHCEAYHGRRVHKFHWYNYHLLTREDHTVCSLWKDAQEAEKQEHSPKQSLTPEGEIINDSLVDEVYNKIMNEDLAN